MTDPDVICEFCSHSFGSKRSLISHQKTAKYCLRLRGIVSKPNVICDYCDKKFTRSDTLKTHTESCHEKIIVDLKVEHAAQVGDLAKTNAALKKQLVVAQNKIARHEAKIRKLKRYIERKEGNIETYEKVGAATTQIVANNVSVNPRLAQIPVDDICPLTIGTVQEAVSKYTYDLFIKGLPGLVIFITDLIKCDHGDQVIERNYACTDSSRYKFHRLLESKKWVKDDGGAFLGTILDELKEPAKEHITTLTEYIASITGDPNLRDVYDCVLDRAKPIYFGIDSTGDARKTLFESLRAEIKSIAAV